MSATVACAKISSGVSVRGAGAAVGAGGGAGGAGGVTGAVGIGGGGGVMAACFFVHAAAPRPNIRENAAIAAVRSYTLIVSRSYFRWENWSRQINDYFPPLSIL